MYVFWDSSLHEQFLKKKTTKSRNILRPLIDRKRVNNNQWRFQITTQAPTAPNFSIFKITKMIQLPWFTKEQYRMTKKEILCHKSQATHKKLYLSPSFNAACFQQKKKKRPTNGGIKWARRSKLLGLCNKIIKKRILLLW